MSQRTYNLILTVVLLLVLTRGAAEAQRPGYIQFTQLERSVVISADVGTDFEVDWAEVVGDGNPTDYQTYSVRNSQAPFSVEIPYTGIEAGYVYVEAWLAEYDRTVPEWPIVWTDFAAEEFFFAEGFTGTGEVAISEVAWSGTAAGSADEWLELYNNLSEDVWLAGWTLTTQDGSPTIVLTGTIPANGHWLLERTDDTTVSDIPADQIYVGSLHNEGESLTLRDELGVIVDVANATGGPWPAGTAASGSPPYASMERVDTTLPENWVTNDGLLRHGRNADGGPINGTPTASKLVEPMMYTVGLPIIMKNYDPNAIRP